MYSLTPGYRIPAVQRGLSPAESIVTKVNAGVGTTLMLSSMAGTPPLWTFGAVGTVAALVNAAPGPRSIGRWAAVGYRHLRERTAPGSMTGRPGATQTWELYPRHGTMQDTQQRAGYHEEFARALTFAAGQVRGAGVQVHVTHHADVGEYTIHTQTVSVHIPQGLAVHPRRILDTLEGELEALGNLVQVEPEPVLTVTEQGPGWVGLEDGRYASTARITGWPEEAGGDLMPRLLLGQTSDRSLAVLYRPLPASQSRRSAKWQAAAAEAFTNDRVKAEQRGMASSSTYGALVQGDSLVDLDAYLTVWGDHPDAMDDARWQASLTADRHRIRLDWLTGQQHRAHVMTTPHGASTRKGAVL